MSGYKNYVPWNKSTATSSNYKKEPTPSKYDTNYRIKSDAKKDDDKSATSRIASKYSGYNASTYQSGYGGKTASKISKPIVEKKDTSHPPVSYRSVARTGARSRDPSPVLDKSSSSSSYDLNRLYPRSYSRERTDSTSSNSTIPKYTGRSSTSKEDIVSKYAGRSSISKDDVVPKYGGRSSINKDDLVPKYSGRSSINRDDVTPTKYGGRTSITKDDPLSRYKVDSRRTSREDLSSSSTQKSFINSRFLPKNSIVKSHTAYTRPSTIRSNETSRKNRELLNVLHAQHEQERYSRPSSRCSSIAPEDYVKERVPEVKNEVEMETVTMITRSTSPSSTSQPTSFLRSRRVEVAKTVEKQITRPKKRPNMIDKEIQSDRMDDSTRTSRFANASRITATPWSSFLDMKFSSPSTNKHANKAEEPNDNSSHESKSCDSPKSISRTSSTKSLSQSSCKSEGKNSKEVKKIFKSKLSPPKQSQSSDKKQLPPQIPKSENSKPNSLHSLNTPNKDFRKSVLNMNPEGKILKKLGTRRSNSASSAESESSIADADATDVSENLTTCNSYHKSNSSSKLPQKVSLERNRRSPSSDTSSSSSATVASGSEDDAKNKKLKKLNSAASSRTSVILSSADDLSVDKSNKSKSKQDSPKSEAEAKSFLMRALAPVTNLFKSNSKSQDNSDKVNWMDSTESSEGKPLDLKPAKIVIHRIESGERGWWMEETSGSSKDSRNKLDKPQMRHVESGEIPWWLDQNAEIPEGVETYPNFVREDGTTADGRVIYKFRKNESDESSWWLDSSDKTNTDSKSKPTNIMDSEYFEKHKIRHIDSGERAWWLSSSENISEMVQAQEDVKDVKPKYAIRHQEYDSDKAWWLQQGKESDTEDDPPLGDRASPEGLEMPKEEGRLSPYDNVPMSSHGRYTKKPVNLFISRHTNIDEILGGSTQLWSPLINKVFGYDNQDKFTEVDVGQVIIHNGGGGAGQRTKTAEDKSSSSCKKVRVLRVVWFTLTLFLQARFFVGLYS